jgi:hypothetical protein
MVKITMFNDENKIGLPDADIKYVKDEIAKIDMKLGPNLKKYFMEKKNR